MQGRLVTAYGFDPSLRHGALVQLSAMFGGEKPSIVQATSLYQWTQRSPSTLTERSRPDAVYMLVQDILSRMSPVSGRLLGIDYDDTAAYWTRRPGQVAKNAFLIGYFARAVQSCGIPVIMFSPALVRRLLGASTKADKDEVWQLFTSQVELGLGVPGELYTGDARDALILAYLVAAAQVGYESCLTASSLSRSRASADDAVKAPLTIFTPG